MLPVQSTPVYTLTVPSTGDKVKFRPFLVKEQKSLLVAHSSDDSTVMLNTLKEVIKDCFKNNEDVNKLATFDIEYIFTQIRAKSVGEIVDLKLKCTKCEHENNIVDVPVDLTTIEVERNPDHTRNIMLFDDVGITMNYPTVDIIKKYESVKEDDVNMMFDMIIDCIENIYDSNQVHHAKEQPKEELITFLENLNSEQFAKIKFFFQSVPKLKKDIRFKCPACGEESEVRIEGISGFF